MYRKELAYTTAENTNEYDHYGNNFLKKNRDRTVL